MPFQSVAVTVERTREVVYLSLGSSMGDKTQALNTAIQGLQNTDGVTVEKVSSYLETEPYGGVAKNTFLNAAVKITTFLTPRELLDEIHRIEAEGGRERKIHWADRTIDIDIVLFGNKKIAEPDLIIPHPEWQKRDFVLIPLKEIAPELFLGGFIPQS
jgi:dihydroneopterin aldolase/2-amino-4-hydroxy-6-hydroxymethyldihydropteridine diphosphokinase